MIFYYYRSCCLAENAVDHAVTTLVQSIQPSFLEGLLIEMLLKLFWRLAAILENLMLRNKE